MVYKTKKRAIQKHRARERKFEERKKLGIESGPPSRTKPTFQPVVTGRAAARSQRTTA